MSARRLAALVALVSLAAPGCADENGGASELRVSAATSLTEAFTDYAETFPGADVRLSFGGSDELAAQIRQGARPDVYAAANIELPRALFAERLVEEPVAFATNELVLAVPARSGVRSLDDLARPGMDLVVGAEGVPVGAYARRVLARIDAPRRRAILRNVRSEEPDAKGVLGKLTQGAADAGFAYRSDVAAAGRRLDAVAIPAQLRPQATYAMAVVRGTPARERAQAFIEGLLAGPGARILRSAGFGAPGGAPPERRP